MANHLGLGNTVTDVLNQWAEFGVFAYVLPFLIIFAVVFGILSKTSVLGSNRGVQSVIALAVGLLSLQFDYVTEFFGLLFPYAGIGISVLLVALILMSLVSKENSDVHRWIFLGIGFIIFLVVAINALSDFSLISGYGFGDLGPHLAILVILLVLVAWTIFGKKPDN
jgi:hypothetical protein